MTALYVILALAAFGIVAWLVTVGVYWIVKGAGRATGLDAKVDQFLEVDGDGLSKPDTLKFKEQHPHGGGH